MKQNYLFVHFRETRSPEGEQVYFGISRDGYHWNTVNDGKPVLWSYLGDKGVRDFTITRTKDNKFVILATDLSLAYGFRFKYKNSWDEICHNGSKCLVMWKSDDLIHWGEQEMVQLGDEDFGNLWAPDIIYDEKEKDYVVHWSSNHKSKNYSGLDIYYSRTKDFVTFSKPQILYASEVSAIDSAMYYEDGYYYLFVKNMQDPCRVLLFRSANVTGPWERVEGFETSTGPEIGSKYEAPTAFKAEDGKWVLMLDFFGADAYGQGYVPFVADKLDGGLFKRSDEDFSFPYGFKHGTVLTITEEEYDRLAAYKKSANDF